jgi:protein SCO1
VTRPARRGLIAFLIAAVIVIGGFVYEEFLVPPSALVHSPFAIGGAFTLTDQNGEVRHDRDFRDKLMLVYFGYSYCPDVCPTTLLAITRALKRLGPRAKAITPIFITVDPDRDTPKQLRTYISNFDPRFVALTGTPAEIAKVASEYHVYYKKRFAADGSYTMDHSSAIYLMGRDGHYIGHFKPGLTAQDLAQGMEKYL